MLEDSRGQELVSGLDKDRGLIQRLDSTAVRGTDAGAPAGSEPALPVTLCDLGSVLACVPTAEHSQVEPAGEQGTLLTG